jgi:hypothetical protein
MTEPVITYDDPTTDRAWFEWLQAKDNEQLIAYWDFVSHWSPTQETWTSSDPDEIQVKYELTAQEMDRRKL